MIVTPSVPVLPSLPHAVSSWRGQPLTLELSGPALTIVLLLIGIFFAVVSVVMVYHWRRFPYEQEIFSRVERLYFLVSFILFGASVFFVFLTL